MIHVTSVTLICPYCNAEIERRTEQEAKDELAYHQNYIQCMKNY